MRTLTDAQNFVVLNAAQADFVRVSVLDTDGTTWQDLDVYPGFKSVASVKWDDDVNNPTATATVTLLRELDSLSLSPYVLASPINLRFNPANSTDALVRHGRELKIDVAICPMDTAPADADWFMVFHGRIDAIDVGQAYNIELTCRDLAGRLAQQFIKTERVYSMATVGGTAVSLISWEPGLTVKTGQYLIPASRGDSDPGQGHFYICTADGVTGEAEPGWPPAAGSVADNTTSWDFEGDLNIDGNPVEDIMQALLTDNLGEGDSGTTLVTPTSPDWDITGYIQSRTPTLDAVRALANQIGWDVRFKWNDDAGDFVFTFLQPDRDTTTSLHSFSASQYLTLKQMSADISEIRNWWRAIIPNSAAPYPDGTPSRLVIEAKDEDSIAKYGELFAEFQEDENSQIDSSTEGTSLVNAALSDTSEPTAQLQADLIRGFPWVELNDLYTFGAGAGFIAAPQFDMDILLAVTAWSHSFSAGGQIVTSLTLRGKPTIGHKVHLRKTVHPHVLVKPKPHHLKPYTGRSGHAIVQGFAIGGAKIQVGLGTLGGTDAPRPYRDALAEEFEHHVFRDAGATLDSTTLYAVTKSTTLHIGDLPNSSDPTAFMYHRMVPRWRNGERLIRGSPTSIQLIIPNQALAGHLTANVDLTRRPLNGGFESSTSRLSIFADFNAPPDHWFMGTGTWGSEFMNGGTTTVSGENSVASDGNASNKEISSDQFPIEGGHVYRMSGWIKRVGAATSTIRLRWLDATRAEIGGSDLIIEDGFSAHDWLPYCNAMTAPTNACFARVDILQADETVGDVFYVTGIDVQKLSMTGMIIWGNASIPDPGSTGTYYMSPSSGGTADATQRVFTVPSNGTTGSVFGQMTVRFNEPAPHCGYTFTLVSNGSDTGSVTISAGGIIGVNAGGVLADVASFELSVRVDATHTSGSSLPPSDVYVTLAIYG